MPTRSGFLREEFKMSRSSAQSSISSILGHDNLTFRGMSLEDGAWTGKVRDNSDDRWYEFVVPCDCPEAASVEPA